MYLLERLKKFLDKNFDNTKPVLLAMSGGPDSRCMFELLMSLKDSYRIDLHIAHVDHSLRKESEDEAESLKKEMIKRNIPFHFKKLNLKNISNIEGIFRLERLKFFNSLFEKNGFQAIFIAHQKEDLAETVLKRVLEGANLYNMGSMQEVSFFENNKVFRPLLAISKKDILNFLHINNIGYFIDKTNEDTKFLRANMRKNILPLLQQTFKKKIIDNLIEISKNSSELNNYLKNRLDKKIKEIKKNSLALYIDLSDLESLEIKFIVKHIANMEEINVSRDVLENISNAIYNKKANHKVALKDLYFIADRGSFFIEWNKEFIFDEISLENEGTYEKGIFQIKISREQLKGNKNHWSDFFNKSISVLLPKKKFKLQISNEKKIKKIFERNKVPSFLRNKLPILCDDKSNVYDFLSNKNFEDDQSDILKVELFIK